jgi:hypothetical protein
MRQSPPVIALKGVRRRGPLAATWYPPGGLFCGLRVAYGVSPEIVSARGPVVRGVLSGAAAAPRREKRAILLQAIARCTPQAIPPEETGVDGYLVWWLLSRLWGP